MKKGLYISLFLFLISYSNIYSQDSNLKISEEYKRIENSNTLKIDSVSLKRGIDFGQGSNADEKIYKIFKKGKRIIKIEYEERNEGYRKWQKKTTIYLKNNLPFFIVEKSDGTMTLYTSNGEKAEPYKNLEEIYIYNWNEEKFTRFYNGHLAIPEMKICKICYEELIKKVKSEIQNKKVD